MLIQALKIMTTNDTIAAIATAPGEAGIAIIRVSGPASLAIADQLFIGAPPPSRRPAGSCLHGWLRSTAQTLDEILLLSMPAPRSYTREDVVEFQCHGGMVSARRILQAVLKLGARLAEPGEFTRRAFLNGRLDLVQAEAVLDLIRARTDRAAAAAVEQLEGRLSSSFNDIYASLSELNADLEVMLDFSEDDLTPEVMPGACSSLRSIHARIQQLLETWQEGHLLREGALVVISGKPNVGKSTLLNGLLGKERAIVSPAPGTTRDIIEENLVLDCIPLRLVDTAGLRLTDCDIESQGVKRARHYMAQADLHIYMVDASQSLQEDDRENLGQLEPGRTILILNKTDLGRCAHIDPRLYADLISACLIRQEGLSEIRRSISQRLGAISGRPAQAVIAERHRQILLVVSEEILSALSLLETGREEVLIPCALHLRTALESLGTITGKTYYDALLDSIFSRFCIGK